MDWSFLWIKLKFTQIRGQRGIAEILKGNPKYLGTSLAKATPNFSSGFMVGFGKHQLLAIWSWILDSSSSPGPRPLSSVSDFMMALGKPQPHANFEIASFSRCRNIIGNPKIFGSCPCLPARDNIHVFFWVRFYYGPWQLAAAYQFWSPYLQLMPKY